MSEPTFDVYLSHNSRDKPEVRRLAELLKNRGLNPWLDEWELRPGMAWQQVIEQQIASVRTAAVCIGQHGLGPWQASEVDHLLKNFAESGKTVVPVILPNCQETPELPPFLSQLRWVDFRTTSPDPLEQLIWGITGARPKKQDVDNDDSLKQQLEVEKLEAEIKDLKPHPWAFQVSWFWTSVGCAAGAMLFVGLLALLPTYWAILIGVTGLAVFCVFFFAVYMNPRGWYRRMAMVVFGVWISGGAFQGMVVTSQLANDAAFEVVMDVGWPHHFMMMVLIVTLLVLDLRLQLAISSDETTRATPSRPVPVLANYQGFLSAEITDADEQQSLRLPIGSRGRLIVRLTPDRPSLIESERVNITGGTDDFARVTFRVQLVSTDVDVEPTVAEVTTTDEGIARATFKMTCSQEGMHTVHIQLYQLNRLVAVLPASIPVS